MKYVKMLALAAVAAAALMAFIGAGTASATVLCSTTVDPCPAGQTWPAGTTIDFSLKAGTTAKLVDTSEHVLDECTGSTVKGNITNAGSGTATTTGTITELTWTGCTHETVTTVKGCLEIHRIASTSNGTLTSDECDGGIPQVTINTETLFGSCVYGIAQGVSIGDLTEGKGTGALFTANAVAKKLTGSNFACPETARWTATYVLTSPSATTLSVSSSSS